MSAELCREIGKAHDRPVFGDAIVSSAVEADRLQTSPEAGCVVVGGREEVADHEVPLGDLALDVDGDVSVALERRFEPDVVVGGRGDRRKRGRANWIAFVLSPQGISGLP